MLPAERPSVLGEVAGVLAHEIGTPVTAIQVALERMERRGDLLAGSEEMAMVRGQVHRLGALAGLLRSLALPGRPDLQAVDLAAVARELADWLKPVLEREMVELTLAVADPPPAWADPTQFRSVLLALVLNARQAVRLGPAPRAIALRVMARRGLPWVEVSDSGPGVPPAEVDRIFLPFVSTWNGPGIGLAQARLLVEGWGGELRLGGSPEGTGATFIIDLRRADEP